ncbi:MAG TPA: hypothetical protein VET48_11355, partial [Steroidobacteraceae bacterium]|nr:hypothetical protein [Steroidobacteraceae bacterium]
MTIAISRNFFCGVLAALLTSSIYAADDSAATASGGGKLEESVVKVFASMRVPDPTKPWTKQAPGEVTGSGVVIGGNRILTNAHVVLYANEIQVQANQS